MNKEIDWKTTLLGEIFLFGVLSKLLQTYIEQDWLQSLVNEEVFSESPLHSEVPDVQAGLNLLQSWCAKNLQDASTNPIRDLKLDYTQLFIGLGKVLAPPWESVYFSKERLVFQEETLQVRNWYRRFDLEAEHLYQEPDDHIALELSFITHLSTLALQAIEEKDEIQVNKLLDAQRQFILEHPLRWVPAWSKLVEEHAQTDFYRGVALLTRGGLLTIANVFEIEVPEDFVP